MATKFGSVWAQWIGWLGAENATHTAQVNPSDRSVTITSGITLQSAGGGWVEAGVWRIISNGQLEEFDPPVPNISRNNVTQIVFMTRASGCWVRASHEITYWN